jgi:hypothetical protein
MPPKMLYVYYSLFFLILRVFTVQEAQAAFQISSLLLQKKNLHGIEVTNIEF